MHEVLVVRLGPITKHENADALGLTVVNGYTVVVRLECWKEGDLAVFIEPDYIVPEGVSWMPDLEPDRKVRVKKLRGTYSPGCLIPLADVGLEGVEVGTNVMERLGITRYVNDGPLSAGEEQLPDSLKSLANLPRSSLETYQKVKHLLKPELPVYITEKVNGKSARYAFREGRMWCGSREQWVKQGGGSEAADYWTALKNCPWIEHVCREYRDLVLYGEVYGSQKGFKYGLDATKCQFRVFYVFKADGQPRWLTNAEINEVVFSQHRVPILYEGLLGGANVEALAEGKSIVFPTQVREGCVITSANEDYNPTIGRLAFKCVGNGYLAKS